MEAVRIDSGVLLVSATPRMPPPVAAYVNCLKLGFAQSPHTLRKATDVEAQAVRKALAMPAVPALEKSKQEEKQNKHN